METIMQSLGVVRAPGGLGLANVKRSCLRERIPHGLPHVRHVQYRSGGVRAVVASPTKQADALEYRKLGDSDLVISEITLGTMTWGNQNTEKEGQEQLAYAFDHGINILDTAEAYPIPMNKETQGRTDRIVSGWLKTMPRDKVIVATKVAGYSERLTHLRDSGKVLRVDRENIKESVEKSLKRLDTDYIDLLQIHWPDRYTPLFGESLFDAKKFRDYVPFAKQLEVFQELIQEGKVRYIGVSNETSFGVMEFLYAAKTRGLPKIVSIQNSYSLLARSRFEVDLVEVCAPMHGNVGLLAYSPLAGGSLTGKYITMDAETAKKGRLGIFPGFMDRYNKSLARDAVAAYCEVAKRHNITPTQLALAFCRDRQFMTSTIIGATSMEQLKENISAFQIPRPLAQEINDDIDSVFKKFRDPSLF